MEQSRETYPNKLTGYEHQTVWFRLTLNTNGCSQGIIAGLMPTNLGQRLARIRPNGLFDFFGVEHNPFIRQFELGLTIFALIYLAYLYVSTIRATR